MKSLTQHPNWAEALQAMPEDVRTAINGAIATRGRRKGWALAKCPPARTAGAAGWQAIMRVWNPYKVSIGMCILWGDKELIEKCVDHLRAIPYEVRSEYTLDLDRASLDPVW
jgi:hypothetical protein